ncbi:MAG: hypothetical protein M3511_13645 [Deinococcota bacterium]|nr:hypothetical protein [Deinococcota bacterium]
MKQGEMMTLRLPPLWVFMVTVFMAAAAIMTVTAANAQDMTADEIVDNLNTTIENMNDARFMATGQFTDMEGTSYDVAMEVEAIFAENIARVTFMEPEEAADNIVILDGDTIYNYLAMTNQLMMMNTTDQDALGGYFQNLNVETVSLDLGNLFEGWNATLLESDEAEEGTYTLRFRSDAEEGLLAYVDARVEEVDGDWIPQEMNFVGQDGMSIARLLIEDFEMNPGLDAETLRELPEDAEMLN